MTPTIFSCSDLGAALPALTRPLAQSNSDVASTLDPGYEVTEELTIGSSVLGSLVFQRADESAASFDLLDPAMLRLRHEASLLPLEASEAGATSPGEKPPPPVQTWDSTVALSIAGGACPPDAPRDAPESPPAAVCERSEPGEDGRGAGAAAGPSVVKYEISF